MLTGNRRVRVGFGKKLIVQVEYKCGLDDNDPREFRWTTKWRDATIEDIMPEVDLSDLSIVNPSNYRKEQRFRGGFEDIR